MYAAQEGSVALPAASVIPVRRLYVAVEPSCPVWDSTTRPLPVAAAVSGV